MGLLTPAAFLSALPALFGATRSKGSLYLTVKRVKRLRGRKGEAQCAETHCLVRAKAGKKRISTTVPEAEVEGFRAELGVVLGENMTGLLKEGERGRESASSKGKGKSGGSGAGAGAGAGGEGGEGAGADKKKKKKKRR